MSPLQRYMDKKIKRCLSNPAVLVLAPGLSLFRKAVKSRLPQLGNEGPLSHFRIFRNR